MRRYFVTDVRRAVGALKMERALVDNARLEYSGMIIHEERMKTVVERLQWMQEELLRDNPRWTKVEICWDKNPLVKGVAFIMIGTSQVSLAEVMGEII